MSVSVDDYIDKVVDMCNIRIEAAAHVEQTDQHHCESDDFRLLKPDLDVKVFMCLKNCVLTETVSTVFVYDDEHCQYSVCVR